MIEAKKVVIWGAGKRGKNAYDLLSKYSEFCIIAFGDSNRVKQGGTICGIDIIGVEDIPKTVDCIVIASSYSQIIYEQLTKKLDITIYKDVSELLYRFSIEITGWCNAKCKWCSTGRKNRAGRCISKYMSINDFKKIYMHLREIHILHTYNEILLYSWGEPLLNPDYLKIVEFLSKENQHFSISTNASTLRLTDMEKAYQNCEAIVFSMSGYSQQSYDKIHGFNIDQIKSNIKILIENMREHGFEGKGLISYHAYKFNENEVKLAKEFAENLNLEFVPVNAYFASYDLMSAYLQKKMSPFLLKE